jgi:hypothetical protein
MSAPTDCRGADQFQPNHRAGYGDRLAFLVDWLTRHPDATLASGEGKVLLDEIVRLRAQVDRLRQEAKEVGLLLYTLAEPMRDRFTTEARQALDKLKQELTT